MPIRIAYLQVDKVKQILEEIPNDEFIEYLKSITYYGYTYLRNPFRLTDNAGANICRNKKPLEYDIIEQLLTKKINECGGEKVIFTKKSI